MPAPNKGRKFPAEVLSDSEMLRLLAELGRGYAGARDRALTAIQWRAGLRIAEALALQMRDLDLKERTVTVRHGKGNKRRVLGMDAGLVAYLEVWLAQRQRLGVPRGAPVFCVISRPSIGKPLYSSVYREKLKEAARRAGIEKNVRPHGLRHTAAVNWRRERQDLLLIQHALGHADVRTTYHYLNHLEDTEVLDMMRGREWPGVSHVEPSPARLAA